MTRKAFSIRFILIILVSWLAMPSRASGSDEAVASLRARLADYGRLEIEVGTRRGNEIPRDLAGRADTAFWGLQKEPLEHLLPAIDACIREGTAEERIGAMGVYSSLVYRKMTRANPEYRPLLINLLARDNLQTPRYTGGIRGLLYEYPSAETAKAFMDVAHRAPDKRMRVEYVEATAALLGIWLDIYTNSTEAQVDKAISDFEAWYAKNKDRIQFTKNGKLRLSGRKPPEEEKAELTAEDRARVRENAVCVLQLMSLTLSDGADEEESNAKAPALNAKCGPALFGAERSALMGRMAAAVSGGSGPPLEMEAELQGSSGYPTADAMLLAAATVSATEKDPAALRLAEETLARATRAEIRRACKGEPSSVRRKAESLAGRKE